MHALMTLLVHALGVLDWHKGLIFFTAYQNASVRAAVDSLVDRTVYRPSIVFNGMCFLLIFLGWRSDQDFLVI
jgi:hypothetical protein